MELKKQCRFDLLALGEVMLRFDPGDKRIRTAESFQVWEGGGEYNVARGLSNCFGKKTAVLTVLVDNEIGQLIHNKINAGGVDTSLIKWLEDDGIGEKARNGIYFLEKGFGVRPALGTSDRGHTAISKLKPQDTDWEKIFGELGVRWFHTGGIYAGLSQTSPEVILEAIKIARRHGTIVSYDLNYRPSLWKRFGGKAEADRINRKILEQVDVLFGFEGLEEPLTQLDAEPFKKAILKMKDLFPNLQAIASTMRFVRTAKVNDWSGLLWADGNFYQGLSLPNLEIFDRVGGGDAFASGLIEGFLEKYPLQKTINYAVAHGALTMTTPGDNSMSDKADIERLIHQENSGVIR